MIELSFILTIDGIGEVVGPQKDIQGYISTDSRTIKGGDFFLALQGPNFDGAQYIENVLQKNTPVIIATSTPENKDKILKLQSKYLETTFILVKDSLIFYQNMAKEFRKNWQSKNPEGLIIGITGSNGKTTTKEMLSFFFKKCLGDKTLYNQKNFNNHIGIPQTLLGIKEDTEHIILEMGTNHPGEIGVLCDMAAPNAGIITNIGHSHLEFFENQENIFKEKRVLFDCVAQSDFKKKYFVLSGDDPFLKNLSGDVPTTYISSTKSDDSSQLCEIDNDALRFVYKGHTCEIKNSYLTGVHNYYNLAMALIFVLRFFPEKIQELIQAATDFCPEDNRSAWVTKWEKSFFMDAYNANPSSMMAAIHGFLQYCEDHQIKAESFFFVVGDMNELGESTATFHEDLGKFFKEKKIKNVAFVGRFAEHFLQGCGSGYMTSPTVENFKEKHWPSVLQKHTHFFLKASRSVALETLLDT